MAVVSRLPAKNRPAQDVNQPLVERMAMLYRPGSVCRAVLAACSLWATAVWPVALLWRSLAALLLALVFVWPLLVRLLHTIAQHAPAGPRGRAYAAWMAATALTTGRVLPRLLDVLGASILVGSVMLIGIALASVHPLLVPLACAPLWMRSWLCAWVAQHVLVSTQ